MEKRIRREPCLLIRNEKKKTFALVPGLVFNIMVIEVIACKEWAKTGLIVNGCCR